MHNLAFYGGLMGTRRSCLAFMGKFTFILRRHLLWKTDLASSIFPLHRLRLFHQSSPFDVPPPIKFPEQFLTVAYMHSLYLKTACELNEKARMSLDTVDIMPNKT